MLDRLNLTSAGLSGPRRLLMDAEDTRTAIAALKAEGIDRLVILQVTFTDAAMTVEAAKALEVPLGIWAVPEPRLGGRLRLNAFCGLNLASHALGLEGRDFSWLFSNPDTLDSEDLNRFLAGEKSGGRIYGSASPESAEAGSVIARSIYGKRIGRIGEHPDGFHTCAYSPDKLQSLAGVAVDEIALDTLFETAREAGKPEVENVRELAAAQLDDLYGVDQGELDRSLRLKVALEKLRSDGGYDAFAIRCWPETFTEYGGAVCGPVSMMGEARRPCACEADVYGALTQLLLQEAAKAPVFLTDLVDADVSDDTMVVWHCGQAPVSMCRKDAKAVATIHTNRKMPLLYQFALKPGRVTFARVSQAFGETKLVLGGGEMLDRPMAFTGTSGVVRFDRGTSAVLDDIIASGLEHHMALAYGEHRTLLRSVAAAMNLPVVEL